MHRLRHKQVPPFNISPRQARKALASCSAQPAGRHGRLKKAEWPPATSGSLASRARLHFRSWICCRCASRGDPISGTSSGLQLHLRTDVPAIAVLLQVHIFRTAKRARQGRSQAAPLPAAQVESWRHVSGVVGVCNRGTRVSLRGHASQRCLCRAAGLHCCRCSPVLWPRVMSAYACVRFLSCRGGVAVPHDN